MRKKRLSQIDLAIAKLDDQITALHGQVAVLQHARRVLEQQQAEAARPPRVRKPPTLLDTAANG